MARKGFITTGTQHFPHVQVVAAFPTLPPGSEPWGESRHLVSTHQASTARFIWKLSHLQPYLFFNTGYIASAQCFPSTALPFSRH